MSTYLDLSNIQFYHSTKAGAGRVEDLQSPAKNVISLSGRVDPTFVREQTRPSVLMVDKYQRYLTHVCLNRTGAPGTAAPWTIRIPLSNLTNVPPKEPLQIFLMLPEQGVALVLAWERDLYGRLEDFIAKSRQEDVPEPPTLKSEMLQLIRQASQREYVSRSNRELIRTGNNYQTLDLGDTVRLGARSKRHSKLSRIRFKNKKVLDLGANTGEISRYIRRRGARIVDGYEYDPFFVETGRLINAYLGVTRVSLYQGDATNPGLYRENYDIVVALSVYVYIKDVLKEIAAISDALLLETHQLGHGLGFYLATVMQYFPFFRHLGYTEEDPHFEKSRALLLFTKTPTLGDQLTDIDEVLIPEGRVNYYYGDKRLFLPAGGIFSEDSTRRLREEGVEAFLNCLDTQYGAVRLEHLPDEGYRFFSELYWPMYLLGYLDYLKAGRCINDSNRFLQYYRRGIDKGIIDNNLSYLLKERNSVYKKLSAKYADFDLLQTHGVYAVAPLYLTKDSRESGAFTFATKANKKIRATGLDGHHRLFLAKFLGASTFPYYEAAKSMDNLAAEIIKGRYTLCDAE